MNRDDPMIAEAAAKWHAAEQRDDMDWNGFTQWLAADPRHRTAYDQIALTADVLDAHPDLLAQAAPVQPAGNVATLRPRRRWPMWLGTGIAASLAALMVAGQVIGPRPQTFTTDARPQTIALGRGSNVVLAPRSSLTMSGPDGTELALDGGAYFDIRHDPTRSLVITAGDVTVTDIGTRFEIRNTDHDVLVEVAVGEVTAITPTMDKAAHLAAGHRFNFDPRAGRAVVSAVAPADVGEWREGRLSYDSAPLELVADDLARYTGARVVVPQSLGQRRFSGSLFIGDGDAAIRDLAQLMQLRLQRDGAGYRLEPAG